MDNKSFNLLHPIYAIFFATLASCIQGCGATIPDPTNVSNRLSVNGVPVIIGGPPEDLVEGLEYSYQIQATDKPTRFAAVGLPPGLIVDASTGIIAGDPLSDGDFTVVLSASNQNGTGIANAQMHVSATSGSACDPITSAPAPAAAAHLHNLAFCDDFNSLSTIDVKGTGAPGFNWYTTQPQWFGGHTMPSEYSVSNSILTLDPAMTAKGHNWQMTTRDPKTGNGNAWIFGYFEARISFDPSLGPQSPGFPAFWALSARFTQYFIQDEWGELDFFEAGTGGYGKYSGDFQGTVHQFANFFKTQYWNSNNVQWPRYSWAADTWHTIGCLWLPGEITWYLDGKSRMTQRYSYTSPPDPPANTSSGTPPAPAGTFSILEQPLGMQIILGSGPNWPLKVDWVRVWQ